MRWRQMRNFLATLLLSQGVPMLQAGDEIGRTQQGNNNAYCQDNEISWIDWDIQGPCRDLLDFTRSLVGLFHQHPALRRRRFFQGRPILGSEVKDITWLRPDGKEMTDRDWQNPQTRALGLLLAGDAIGETDERGNRIVDGTLFLVFNAFWGQVSFLLPGNAEDHWQVTLDTRESRPGPGRKLRGGARYRVEGRSVTMFCLPYEEREADRRCPPRQR